MKSQTQTPTDFTPIRCRYCTVGSSSDGHTRRELRDCQGHLLKSQDDNAKQREHIGRLQHAVFTLQEFILDLYAQFTLPSAQVPDAPHEADEGFESGD